MVDLGVKNWQSSLSFVWWLLGICGAHEWRFKNRRHSLFHGAGVLGDRLVGIRPVANVKIGIKTNGKICRGGR